MDGIKEVFETRDGQIWLDKGEAISHHGKIVAKEQAIRTWLEGRGLAQDIEVDLGHRFSHLIDVLLFRNEGLPEILRRPLEEFGQEEGT